MDGSSCLLAQSQPSISYAVLKKEFDYVQKKDPFLSNLSQTLNLNECIAPQTEGPKRTLVVFAAGAAPGESQPH